MSKPSQPTPARIEPSGQALGEANTLSYTDATRGLVPIPAPERGLPTATAVPYYRVSQERMPLEGPAFDRQGNLLFLDIYNGRVLKLTPDRQLSTVYTEANLNPAGIAVHKDGRIFLAAVGPTNADGEYHAGSVIAIDPDGSQRKVIVAPELGYVPDDLVFDDAGGFYFTDFRGSATNRAGGVYYVPPGHDRVQTVLPDMCGANGVALSPDGKVLWATEYFANRLHRMDLKAPGAIARTSSMVPYHFIGRAPDSMRTDSAGNVYVAMQRQGRFLVFSPYGVPIGQILVPGREDNLFLQSTSLALMPGSRDLFIVAYDITGHGAMIFAARGLAEGLALYSHQ